MVARSTRQPDSTNSAALQTCCTPYNNRRGVGGLLAGYSAHGTTLWTTITRPPSSPLRCVSSSTIKRQWDWVTAVCLLE
eukprot:scaffold34947_cov145-Amphora_coffeaeformis.AAC.2